MNRINLARRELGREDLPVRTASKGSVIINHKLVGVYNTDLCHETHRI